MAWSRRTTASCSIDTLITSDLRDEIADLNARFAEAYERGDHDAVAAFYTREATSLVPGMEIARGRQAVRDAYANHGETGVGLCPAPDGWLVR